MTKNKRAALAIASIVALFACEKATSTAIDASVVSGHGGSGGAVSTCAEPGPLTSGSGGDSSDASSSITIDASALEPKK